MKTFASLFSGFDGVGIGAKAAGMELAWGVEYDAAIAEVGNANLGNHIKVANILDCNPRDFERVDVLHMSPPCTRASVANGSAEVNEDGLKESPLDIAMADKCIEFIETLNPEIVTLENVWGYRAFQSWRGGKRCEGIQQALYRLGYWISVEHVNAANYSVPQTRKRMIVRAIRGGFVPYLPQPEPWVGWYAAIEDLIPALPDTQFAPWQLARLPEELRTMIISGKEMRNDTSRSINEPMFTVMASDYKGFPKALLFTNTGGAESFGDHHVWAEDPAGTVTTQSLGRERAFLVGKNQDKFGDGLRWLTPPAQTIVAKEHGSKAFIIDCQNAGDPSPDRERLMTIRNAAQPMFTVTSSIMPKRPCRAFDGGRVVAMTPRCLARFQSFPDWYQLSGKKTLDAKGIGNAVCPLMMEKIYRGLLS